MTPEAQRIAIAEACGLDVKVCPIHRSRVCCGRGYPDYLADLNAIHGAEKTLFASRPGYYDRSSVTELIRVLGYEQDTGLLDKRMVRSLLNATAAERAEAFLRTIGKWTGP